MTRLCVMDCEWERSGPGTRTNRLRQSTAGAGRQLGASPLRDKVQVLPAPWSHGHVPRVPGHHQRRIPVEPPPPCSQVLDWRTHGQLRWEPRARLKGKEAGLPHVRGTTPKQVGDRNTG